MSTIDTKPERRVTPETARPGRIPGARSDATVSCEGPLGSVGPTTITASRGGSTDASIWPRRRSKREERSAGRRRGRAAQSGRAPRSKRTRSESSTSTTARPVHARRRMRRGTTRIDADAEGIARAPVRGAGLTPPAGRHAVGSCERVRDLAVLTVARPSSVLIGIPDHRPVDAGGVSATVPEHSRMRVEEQIVVVVDDRGERRATIEPSARLGWPRRRRCLPRACRPEIVTYASPSVG